MSTLPLTCSLSLSPLPLPPCSAPTDRSYALLADLLELHPGNRPRASKALRHPFFQVCLSK